MFTQLALKKKKLIFLHSNRARKGPYTLRYSSGGFCSGHELSINSICFYFRIFNDCRAPETHKFKSCRIVRVEKAKKKKVFLCAEFAKFYFTLMSVSEHRALMGFCILVSLLFI